MLSNAEISDRLAGVAQLLSTQKKKSYKVRAYQRAATNIRSMGESVEELVREKADLTQFPGIGDAMAAVIRQIVVYFVTVVSVCHVALFPLGPVTIAVA